MDVTIHFPPNLDVDKDVIEDALDEAIGELGEVSGGGIGEKGMTIDLDVEDDADPAELVDLIRGTLKELGAPFSKIVIDGRTYR